MSVSTNPASQPPALPPRPPNEWMLFRAHFCRLYKLRDDRDPHLNGTGLSGLASALWATYSPEEKKQWRDRAKEASERHAAFFPNYKYQPKRKGEGNEKKQRGRKQREGRRTAGTSKGVRFVPYARPSSEDSGAVSEPMLPVDFDLSGVPPLTAPYEISPSTNDTIYTLPPPATFPQYSLQAPTPTQASQMFTGWNWESAQTSTTGSVPQFPSTSSSYSQEPQFNALPPQDDDYTKVVPDIDVLDQFLQNHPEDKADVNMTPTQSVVENMWDYVKLDGFGSV